MTSRERVLATIQGKPVDRVASDFRAEAEVFQALEKNLGLASIEEVLLWAKSDFRDLSFLCNDGGYGGYSCFGWKDKQKQDGTFEDLWGVRRRKAVYNQGAYMDIIFSPLHGANGIDKIRKHPFPDPRGIYDFCCVPDAVKRFNGKNEFFYLMEGKSLFDRCWAVRGFEDFFVDLVADEKSTRYVIGKNYSFMLNFTRMLLEQAGGAVDAVGMYDDFGNQRELMISSELYRKYFKDLQREYIQMVKAFGVKIFYHSCGAITGIVPDLADIGVDILDPFQFAAMKISPEHLFDIVGNRVTFHGGIDLQGLFVRGSVTDVKDSVRNLRRTLGQNGRYILSCSHLIQMDTPIDNIKALVEMVQ